jgi:hypothetical protein
MYPASGNIQHSKALAYYECMKLILDYNTISHAQRTNYDKYGSNETSTWKIR